MKRNYKYDKIYRNYSFFAHLKKGMALLCITLLSFSCANNNKEETESATKSPSLKAIYTCPMHPEIEQDKPGKCPKCQMDLVLKENSKEIYYCPMHPEVEQDHPGECAKCGGMKLVLKDPANYLETVLKPVSSNVLSKIGIIKPEYKTVPVEITALGYIDYDNYAKFDLSSRYNGRIEKLYIKYNYQPIKKGDVAFEIYSPDLVTAQENLIYLLNTSPEEKKLIAAATKKLELLQLTPKQIEEIISSKKVKNTISVYSEYEGHVHEVMNTETQPMTDYSKSPILSVKEGMYVERGQILFNIVNPYQVVVMLKIKSVDIGKIKLKDKVSFSVNNDSNMIMNGKVDFIEPVLANNSKSMMVRINIDKKDHKHKIGSLVNAKISSDNLESLWVPSSSVVDLGKTTIVWVWKDGFFKAVKIETGIRINNWIEVADGLTEADQIASEAHYLSDSEGFIKVNTDEEN